MKRRGQRTDFNLVADLQSPPLKGVKETQTVSGCHRIVKCANNPVMVSLLSISSENDLAGMRYHF